ncbi:MAG: hypothetical protein Tsb002_19670 [Wenzhouxiangellaceae bacterium]
MPLPLPPRFIYWLTIALTLILTAMMALWDARLQAVIPAVGIIDLEFAGHTAQARWLMELWAYEAPGVLSRLQQWDTLYPLLYGLSLGWTCSWAVGGLKAGVWRQVGCDLSWLVFLATVLDLIENLGLWQVMRGSTAELWPRLAWWCAWGKFAILMTVAVYLLSCVVLLGGRRLLSRHA